jgi:TRAP-type C4-dicarboxylate transport system permease small subunit
MAYVSEIVTIGFLYVYMLGAAALYVRNEDIVLDFIYLRFGMRVRAVWLLVIHLAIAATMLVALDATLQMIALQRHVPTPLLRIPLVTQHYAFVAAAAIIMLSSLVNALGCLVALRAGHDPLHHRAATES